MPARRNFAGPVVHPMVPACRGPNRRYPAVLLAFWVGLPCSGVRHTLSLGHALSDCINALRAARALGAHQSLVRCARARTLIFYKISLLQKRSHSRPSPHFSGPYNLKKQKQKMRRKQLRPWDEHSSPKTRSENEGGAVDEEGPGGSCAWRRRDGGD